MAKIKKGQLEKIIQKEYINVLKEVKNNEAYFNHIAYEYVTQSLETPSRDRETYCLIVRTK